jgi:hypothetical protein
VFWIESRGFQNRRIGVVIWIVPFALRQLYLACVTSIADYGSPI